MFFRESPIILEILKEAYPEERFEFLSGDNDSRNPSVWEFWEKDRPAYVRVEPDEAALYATIKAYGEIIAREMREAEKADAQGRLWSIKRIIQLMNTVTLLPVIWHDMAKKGVYDLFEPVILPFTTGEKEGEPKKIRLEYGVGKISALSFDFTETLAMPYSSEKYLRYIDFARGIRTTGLLTDVLGHFAVTAMAGNLKKLHGKWKDIKIPESFFPPQLKNAPSGHTLLLRDVLRDILTFQQKRREILSAYNHSSTNEISLLIAHWDNRIKRELNNLTRDEEWEYYEALMNSAAAKDDEETFDRKAAEKLNEIRERKAKNYTGPSIQDVKNILSDIFSEFGVSVEPEENKSAYESYYGETTHKDSANLFAYIDVELGNDLLLNPARGLEGSEVVEEYLKAVRLVTTPALPAA